MQVRGPGGWWQGLESGTITLKPREQESAPRVVGRGPGPDKLGRAASDEGGKGSVGQGRITEVLGKRSRARKLRNR